MSISSHFLPALSYAMSNATRNAQAQKDEQIRNAQEDVIENIVRDFDKYLMEQQAKA